MEVAISCGALSCKSPSGSGPRLPLRKSVPSAMCCLALSSTWAETWSTMCLQQVDFLLALQCKDCFVHPNIHVIPVLCKAVGENDASTCTDGVEQCGRKQVAAYSGQRVLEGFHHSIVRWLCHGRAARIDVPPDPLPGYRLKNQLLVLLVRQKLQNRS